MKSAIESEDILKNLRVSLSIFQKSCPNVYQRALALLPADAGVNSFAHYCKNSACVFSRKNPGTPGLVHVRGYCLWCDADELAAAQATKDGQMNLNHSLNIFKKVRPDIYDVAFAKLAPVFPRGAKFCHASGCVYSQRFPGRRARAVSSNLFCVWCDENMVRLHESSKLGVRRLTMALKAFAA